jgi:hypothetical protein
MSEVISRRRQLVDWRAAVWAGLLSGAVFLAVSLLLTRVYAGSAWVVVRLLASVVLGAGVLPPPATFDLKATLAALAVHFTLSVLFACVLAYVIHRWGLIVGVVGGAAFGLALYFINFYTLAYFFPWFFPLRSWMMAVSHVAFGACAGGIYEALEVEKFVAEEGIRNSEVGSRK